MKQYYVKYASESEIQSGDIWNTTTAAPIDQYVWDGTYKPKAQAQLVYTEHGLYLHMAAEEIRANMRSAERGVSDNIYQDSCMEFFVMPQPIADKRYFNFEVNPAGGIYVGLGRDRYDHVKLTELDLRDIKISPFSKDIDDRLVMWGYTQYIPITFLQAYFSTFQLSTESTMRCNFYKCGDLSPAPHFGAWNPVHCPQPDFHQPSFFGALVLG